MSRTQLDSCRYCQLVYTVDHSLRPGLVIVNPRPLPRDIQGTRTPLSRLTDRILEIWELLINHNAVTFNLLARRFRAYFSPGVSIPRDVCRGWGDTEKCITAMSDKK